MTLTIREATEADLPRLAEMNLLLIQDEGHRSQLKLNELKDRMKSWLRSDYFALMFHESDQSVGYALLRNDAEWVYLRQIYVTASRRRQGIGRRAVEWILKNRCSEARRLRIDVLCHNETAIDFWRALGFRDYCLTMEREQDDDPRVD